MIPSILKQEVTYWTKNGQDKYTKPTFDAPVVVKGRWEDKENLLKTNGQVYVISTSTVYMKIALSVGDYVYEGKSVETDPTKVLGARIVLNTKRQVSMNGKTILHGNYL